MPQSRQQAPEQDHVMLHAFALILFAAWLVGFALAVAIIIVGGPEFSHKSGREITPPEKIIVVSVACVLWFVFFLPPIIAILKRKD